LNVSQFKKMVTLSYGNESSKTFQVYNIHIWKYGNIRICIHG
jgi:hypothetical protein